MGTIKRTVPVRVKANEVFVQLRIVLLKARIEIKACVGFGHSANLRLYLSLCEF
jgi:hypothetical protein